LRGAGATCDIGQVGFSHITGWLVRPVVGTSADTPITLRLKAAEFLRLAGTSRNEMVIEELKRLSAAYLEGAGKMEIERAAAPPATNEDRAG
jgi:hypothetical protein